MHNVRTIRAPRPPFSQAAVCPATITKLRPDKLHSSAFDIITSTLRRRCLAGWRYTLDSRRSDVGTPGQRRRQPASECCARRWQRSEQEKDTTLHCELWTTASCCSWCASSHPGAQRRRDHSCGSSCRIASPRNGETHRIPNISSSAAIFRPSGLCQHDDKRAVFLLSRREAFEH